MLTFRKFYMIAVVMAIPFIINCGGGIIPVEEMGKARHVIKKSEAVKAEKYAKEEYDAAKTSLLDSHVLVEAKKFEEAKLKAVEAFNMGQMAFDKSAPLLAKEVRLQAQKAIEEASVAFAEDFAKVEFENSNNFLLEGDQLRDGSVYIDALRQYELAKVEAEKAQDIAVAQAENLSAELDNIAKTLMQAKEYGAREKAPGHLRQAEKDLADARVALSEKKLKTASQKTQSARENAEKTFQLSLEFWSEQIYLKATKQLDNAKAQFTPVEDSIKTQDNIKEFFDTDPEALELLSTARDTLKAAEESLILSKNTLVKKEYIQSKQHADEVERLVIILQDQIPQIAVLLKNKVGFNLALGTSSNTLVQDSSSAKQYTVQKIPSRADCLWRIAGYDYIYDNPILWPKIYKANRSQIKNPDLIFPGQILEIPPTANSIE